MISLKRFKKGYYYYMKYYDMYDNQRKRWEFVGKVLGTEKDEKGKNRIKYKVIKGNFGKQNGSFDYNSLHHRSIIAVEKRKRDLFLYVI